MTLKQLPITRRQAEALAAIIAHKAANDGNPPTIRQLTQALGLRTTSTTYGLIRSLVAAGRITIDPTKARSIQVVGSTWRPPQV